jgi:hypothetical protein
MEDDYIDIVISHIITPSHIDIPIDIPLMSNFPYRSPNRSPVSISDYILSPWPWPHHPDPRREEADGYSDGHRAVAPQVELESKV